MSDPRDGGAKPVRCRAITRAGTRCQSTALPGRDQCFLHDPESAEDRREASRKGGHARSHAARARKAIAGDVRDLADVKARLMMAMAKVETGDLEPGAATAMANLARAIVTVSGAADFELQLSDLRREVAELSQGRVA